MTFKFQAAGETKKKKKTQKKSSQQYRDASKDANNRNGVLFVVPEFNFKAVKIINEEFLSKQEMFGIILALEAIEEIH